MIGTFTALKNFIRPKANHIDYSTFRLHYHGTVVLLFGFCLALSAKVLFGDPIDCDSRLGGSKNLFDTMCYSLGTYTKYEVLANEVPTLKDKDFIRDIPFRLVKRYLAQNNITYMPSRKYMYPGLIIETGRDDKDVLHETVFYHNYYNYVSLVLFIMGILFYTPHFIWKTWENKMVSSVIDRLNSGGNIQETIAYVKKTGSMESVVHKYLICEFLLIFNLGAQALFLNHILNGNFITYGLDFLDYFINDKDLYGISGLGEFNNPLDVTFPKVTGCKISTLSQAGFVPDTKTFMCSLPLNILHDKFFLIIWFWFVALGVITILHTVLNILYILPINKKWFEMKFNLKTYRRSWAELFFLDLIGTNTDRVTFSNFVRELDITENRASQGWGEDSKTQAQKTIDWV